MHGERLRTTETVSETKTITTTTTEIIEEITVEYEVYDRETQTSIERLDHNLDPETTPEVTHIRVEWAAFKDFILRDFHTYADVDYAAKYTVEGATFRKLVKEYKEACEQRTSDDAVDGVAEPSEVKEGDFRQRFLDIMNWCATKGPERGISRPYQNNIKWVLSHDDPTYPARCLGVENPGYSHTIAEVCRWSDVLVVMDLQSSLPKPPAANPPASKAGNGTRGDQSRARKRSSPEDDDDAERVPPKRRRMGDSEDKENPPIPESRPEDAFNTDSSLGDLPLPSSGDKLSQYVMETFSAVGNRRHVLGLCVVGTLVQFRYYDRAGTISSTDIDLDRDAQEFAAAVMCFSLMTSQLLGREPLFTKAAKTIKTNSPFGTLTSAKICVDDLKFEIDKPIYVSRALFGRGTMVYRAFNITDHAAIDDDQADDGAYSFEEKGEVYKPGEAPPSPYDEEEDEYGQEGSVGEEARRKSPPRRKRAPKVVVIKLSWQLVDHDNETELLKDARRGHEIPCTPYLFATRVGGKLSDYDRRFNLPDPLAVPGQFTDRVLRVQVIGPVLMPLHTAEYSFREIVMNIVEGQ